MGKSKESTEQKEKSKMKEDGSALPDNTHIAFSNVSALEAPPFKPDGNLDHYSKSSYEERIIMRKEEAVRYEQKQVEYSYAGFGKEHISLLKKINKDNDLKDNFSLRFTDADRHSQCLRHIAQRIMNERMGNFVTAMKPKNKISRMKKVKPIKGLGQYISVYTPPRNRIKITDNITFNKNCVVPVYSDIENETLENLTIPSSLVYDYIDRNIINQVIEKDLARAIMMSQEKENRITCNCHSSSDGDSIVCCYDNENCPCYKLNKRLRSFQVNKEKESADQEYTEFSTFKPIYFSHNKDIYHYNVGFSCSEECECFGKCTNNALMIAKKNIFPLEIYRVDIQLGFNVRSTVIIPAGTPLMIFTGEVTESRNLQHSSSDYSYCITYDSDEKWRILLREEPLLNFTDAYRTLLLNLSHQSFHIDPKVYGNVGRTFAHSCVPNVELVKIYQKSLSPAHLNLVMVTLEDIFPGTPLTIDYGAAYTNMLEKVCKCGTFACKASKETECFTEMDFNHTASALLTIHEGRYKMYASTILKEKVSTLVSEKNQKHLDITP